MNDIEAMVIDIDEVVRELAQAMQDMRGELSLARSKGGVDLVTDADGYCEERLVSALRQRFPRHGIVAEEGARHEAGDWCWHIDPLDGTANYSRGLSAWAISVGLAFQGKPVAGIICAPDLGLHWLGATGMGVSCNGGACPAAAPAEPMSTWLLGSDNSWDPSARARNLRMISDIACEIRMPLMQGSTAVALGLLCSGRIDGYVLAKAFSWDYCAGAALAAELGYLVQDWSGSAWRVGAEAMLACRPGMAERLAAAIAASR